MEAIQEHHSSFLLHLSNKLKHFFCFPFILEHLELNEELSLTASSKNDCMTAILFQTNTPEFRLNNVSSVDQLECYVHVVKEPEQWSGNRHFFFRLFLSPLCARLTLCAHLTLRAKCCVHLTRLIKRLLCSRYVHRCFHRFNR